MPDEELIISNEISTADRIKLLTSQKSKVPDWKELEKEYDPLQHPIFDKAKFPDKVTDKGLEEVSRISFAFQRLVARRMRDLVCAIPVKRIHTAETDEQREVVKVVERIFKKVNIDSLNSKRLEELYASCQIATLWYAVEEGNYYYKVKSPIKVRCQTYSPKRGDDLYPLFDKYGDLKAFSIGYTKEVEGKNVSYLDTYTKGFHLTFEKSEGDWVETNREKISIAKLPLSYSFREKPIWEDTSRNVYEIEESLSRQGNYLRDNSKPILAVFADEDIKVGNEKSSREESRSVVQYPKGSNIEYITWDQAPESVKMFIKEVRDLIFTTLQIPDWGYSKMISHNLSGEALKVLLIDAHVKVLGECGTILDFLNREINVVKEFALVILGNKYKEAIQTLDIHSVITPFYINDEKSQILNLITANGGEPIMSQKESIEVFGHSKDIEQTMREIHDQRKMDAIEFAE